MTGPQFPGQIGALSAHAPGTAERVSDAVPITAGVLAILGVLWCGPWGIAGAVGLGDDYEISVDEWISGDRWW